MGARDFDIGRLTTHERFFKDAFKAKIADGEAGFFLDAGANDGVYGGDEPGLRSNTLFAEYLGWRGILAEPDIGNWKQLQKNRGPSLPSQKQQMRRTNTQLEHVALYSSASQMQFVGTVDQGSGESALKAPTTSHYRQGAESYMVPAVTISTLFQKHHAPQDIDFVCLDLQGSELPALEGLAASGQYSVKVFVVESQANRGRRKKTEEYRRANLAKWMCSHGYLWAGEALPPSSGDDFYVQQSVLETLKPSGGWTPARYLDPSGADIPNEILDVCPGWSKVNAASLASVKKTALDQINRDGNQADDPARQKLRGKNMFQEVRLHSL